MSRADSMVAVLGWDPDSFWRQLPSATEAEMSKMIDILAPRCGDSYYDMVGDAALLAIIEECLRRAGDR